MKLWLSVLWILLSLHGSNTTPAWHLAGDIERHSYQRWLLISSHFTAGYERGGTSFGPLIALNDDVMLPQSGHTLHPHAEMEILTYVISGQLTHEDTAGRNETLPPGAVQSITAGTGIYHMEMNRDGGTELRFVQMWFLPWRWNLAPRTSSRAPSPAETRPRRWRPLATPEGDAQCTECVRMEQDAYLYAAHLEQEGFGTMYHVKQGRQVYVLCLEGSARALGPEDEDDGDVQHTEPNLMQGEALYSITATTLEIISGSEGVHLLLVDVPAKSYAREYDRWWERQHHLRDSVEMLGHR